jgi:hypothetical protein
MTAKKLERAIQFLFDNIKANSETVWADEIIRKAKAAGISMKTLRRAKCRAHVLSFRHRYRGTNAYYWEWGRNGYAGETPHSLSLPQPKEPMEPQPSRFAAEFAQLKELM